MNTRLISIAIVVIAAFAAAGYLVMARAGDPVIATAQYADPTDRYTHDVIGNNSMMGSLVITMTNGTELRHKLPEDLVFEDTAPRVADVTGDGIPEVIVVESSVTKGARLAVWGAKGRIAASKHIGQPKRWLAPAGIADFDGDGVNDIAIVDRPHLDKILRIFEVKDNSVIEWINVQPLSNHRIGDPTISGGVRTCASDKPELILADANWKTITVISFPNGREDIVATAGRPITGPESFEQAMTCAK